MAGMMNPRIDVTAHLVPGKSGTQVKVTGPINWGTYPAAVAPAPGEPWETAVWFSAIVSQVVPGSPNPQVVTAIGGGDEVYLNGPSPQETWDVTAARIGRSGAFEVGGATVAAWATIAYSDGGSSSYAWTLPVRIES
jgi:hypothetical protein